MIYRRDIDPEKWALRYGLEIRSYKCAKCGCEFIVNVPVMWGDWVGFTSEDHSCGKGFNCLVSTPVKGQAKKNMEELVGV